jgi:Uma2 family endonuclease
MNAPAPLSLSPPQARVSRYRLRVQDYLLLDEAGSFSGEQTELVDGDVIVMSPEWMPHMRIKDEIAYRLRRSIETLGLDLRVGTGGSVALSDTDQPRPDVIVMRPVESDRAVPRDAVLLLVEVSSSTLTFDLNEKAPLYALHGVAEYWTVDVAGRLIHQWFNPGPSGYGAHQEVGFGERLPAASIPGLSIATDGL